MPEENNLPVNEAVIAHLQQHIHEMQLQPLVEQGVVFPQWDMGENVPNWSYGTIKKAVLKATFKRGDVVSFKEGSTERTGISLTDATAATCAIMLKDPTKSKRSDGLLMVSNLLKGSIYPGGNIARIAKIKINNFEESANLFGFRHIKKSLVGNILNIHTLDKGYICKKDGVARDIVSIGTDKGNLKFVLSDCELVFPNINTFNAPKDRTITVGSTVRCIRTKGNNYNKTDRYTVAGINNSDYDYRVRPTTILQIVDSKGNITSSYAKNFIKV